MEDHIQLLQSLLQKRNLSPVEVKDGIVACFIKTNREFVQRRLGNVDLQKVDLALGQLITPVFEQYQIDPQNPDLLLLRRAQEVLEAQSGFEADPELVKMHKDVNDPPHSHARKLVQLTMGIFFSGNWSRTRDMGIVHSQKIICCKMMCDLSLRGRQRTMM